MPRALALFGGDPGGASRRAAIVLARVPLSPTRSSRSLRGSTTVLELRSLDAGADQPLASVTLGDVPGSRPPMPILAVAPDGEHLAVAFHPDHQVLIFRIKDLLAGKSDPIQALRSPGLTIRQAALVRKDEDWGLLLTGSPRLVPVILLAPRREAISSSTSRPAGFRRRRKGGRSHPALPAIHGRLATTRSRSPSGVMATWKGRSCCSPATS